MLIGSWLYFRLYFHQISVMIVVIGLTERKPNFDSGRLHL